MKNGSLQQLDVKSRHLETVLAILDRHLLDHTVWAFGSRVTDKARPYSDLDLVVVGKEPLALSLIADLAEAFDESDLPFKVDIVDWARTNESFRQIINERKIVLREKGLVN